MEGLGRVGPPDRDEIADELDVLNTGHVEKGARVAREGEAGNHRGGWDVRILLAGNSPFQG